MAAKRRRFGRVRKLPSGRWQARYPAPDGTDRPAPHTFRTKADADAWLVNTEADMRRGDWFDPDAGRRALGPYGVAWIAERALKPRTREKYERLWRLHISPYLGDHDLVDLSPAAVRAWRSERLDAGVGGPTVAASYRLLRAVCTTAIDDDLIRRNPCRIKGADKDNSPERPTVKVAEVYAIADAIHPRWRALVLLAAFTTLRWGELIALRHRHLDLDAGLVAVQVSVTETDRELVDGMTVKSAASVRYVGIPAVIIPDLREHLIKWSEAGSTGRVFVGERGATPRRRNFNRLWRKAVANAGFGDLDLHLHDLRHTGNQLAGGSLKDQMARMGHSSVRAALIYQHADLDRERAITDQLSRTIERERASALGHVAGTSPVQGVVEIARDVVAEQGDR